jgi:hypothetical protein
MAWKGRCECKLPVIGDKLHLEFVPLTTFPSLPNKVRLADELSASAEGAAVQVEDGHESNLPFF